MNPINSTKFMDVDELKKCLSEIRLGEADYGSGGIPLAAEDGRVWVDASESHSIIFGTTGSKKTRMLVMPTVEILGRCGESFVVIDPKGEIHSRTAGNIKEAGYNVITINFRDYEAGEHWNPLELPYRYYVGGEIVKAMELVSSVADMLTQQDKGTSNDPYWNNTAKDVAVGLILLLFEEAADLVECTVWNLLMLWQYYLKDRKKFIRRIREDYEGTVIENKFLSLTGASDKTVGSIEAVFATSINRFSLNEKLMDYLSKSGFCYDDAIGKKSAVYIIIPDENNYYHFLVSLFLEQMFEELIRAAQFSGNGRLERRMNFVIDEFASLPKIENMDSMIAAARSRNIRFMLVVQCMSQLTQKYGDMTPVICGNCNNWIYLYSKEYELLSQISRLCGEVIYDNGMRMPLVSEFDLQHLNKEEGEALVLCGRNYPCMVNLMDIDDYPFGKKDSGGPCTASPGRDGKTEKAPVTNGSGKSRAHLADIGRAVSAFGKNRMEYYACGIHGKLIEGKSGFGRQFPMLAELDELCRNIPGKEVAADGLPSQEEIRAQLMRATHYWLLATFQGMVIKSYVTDEHEIFGTGLAYVKNSLNDFYMEDAWQLEWYTGSLELMEKCRDDLASSPWDVYRTVDEINSLCDEKLEKQENIFRKWGAASSICPGQYFRIWEKDPEKYWDYCLYIHREGLEDEDDDICLGKDDGWKGEIGKFWHISRAFRLANLKLKGTEFENRPWKLEEDSQACDDYVNFTGCGFKKYVSGQDYVRLSVHQNNVPH